MVSNKYLHELGAGSQFAFATVAAHVSGLRHLRLESRPDLTEQEADRKGKSLHIIKILLQDDSTADSIGYEANSYYCIVSTCL